MSEEATGEDFCLDGPVPFKIWWLGGGTGRPPSWQGFLRMTRERNEQRAAQKAWKAAKKEALRATKEQWRSGRRDRDLRRWHREHMEGQVVVHEDNGQGTNQDESDSDQENGAPGGG